MRAHRCLVAVALIWAVTGCAGTPQTVTSSLAPESTPAGLSTIPLTPAEVPITPPPTEGAAPEEAATRVADPSAQLSVVNFCLCFGPRDQAQVKVKPQLASLYDGEIAIGEGNFRLVVDASAVDGWSGQTSGTAPTLFDSDGVTVAMIPANRDAWSERLDGSWTFATHWDQTVLSPRAEYLNPAVKAGDLVFYVPVEPGAQTVVVYGLALVGLDPSQVLAYTPFDQWTGDADPNDF